MKHKETIIELQKQALQLERDVETIINMVARIYKVIEKLKVMR